MSRIHEKILNTLLPQQLINLTCERQENKTMQLSAPIFAVILFLSKAGTGFFFFINTWIVISLTGSPGSAAVSLLIAVLPSLLLSMSIGSVADNAPAIKLVLLSEKVRFLTLSIYATVFMLDNASPLIAFAISFIMSICAEIQLLSWRVVLAKFGSNNLIKLNALSVSSGQGGVIVGATASGVVFASFGATATIYTASVLFFGSIILIHRLLHLAPNLILSERSKNTLTPIDHHLKHIYEGCIYIIHTPELLRHYLLIFLNINILYSANALLAPFVKGPLKLGAEAYGAIDAAYSIGAIVGGLIITRLTLTFGASQTITLGLSLLTLALLSFSYAANFPTAFLAHIGIGLGCQTSITSLSYAQTLTRPQFQGIVYAAFNTVTGFSGVLIFLFSTHFTSEQALRNVFFYEALIVAAVTLAFIISTHHKKN